MFNGFPQGANQIAPGATIYILNRKDFKTSAASVASVSQPHVSKSAQTTPAAALQGFVIDLTFSLGGESVTIEFPVNSAGANYPDKGWYVSPDPKAVAGEIEAMANASKQFLSQVPWHEKIVKDAPGLLTQVLPERKAEAEQVKKINALEAQVAEMNKRFGKLFEMLSTGNPANSKSEQF